MYLAHADDSVTAGWRLIYQTLTTTPKTIHLEGAHRVGGVKPLSLAKSKVLKSGKQAGLSLQTAAMATVLSARGTSIAVATLINSVWSMAREVRKVLPQLSPIPDEIRLVQQFLEAEISADFELIELLRHGVGTHHAGLSDETRALIEWLAEEDKLRVLCATTTIAQGINFPVSSVFLASYKYPYGKEMSPREFWNLAGRAGRMNHDSVGVVGLAAGNEPEKIIEYVSKTTGELVSRLVNLLNELETAGRLSELDTVIQGEQWEDFRCYVAHLWNEKKNLDAVLADTEQLLRNTFGYGLLRGSPNGRNKADKLLEATKKYAVRLGEHPERVALADMTGFSPEGVGRAIAGLNSLDRKLTPSDWTPEGLFGQESGMADLFGVMLAVPQLRDGFEDLTTSGLEHKQIAQIAQAWVNGRGIQEIARQFFQGDRDQTEAITQACKAIYRSLVNSGTWGLSALSRLSGVNFEALPDSERRRINMLPAMMYHGVKTEEAVLMRMNSAPRSIAEQLGREFRHSLGESSTAAGVQQARSFLRQLDAGGWERVRPEGVDLSGAGYKRVWELLSGEGRS